MTDRLRLGIFLIAGPVFLGLYCYAALNLPPWGQYRGPYGDMIARLAVYERHATDTVNAINYDYRGFDTLGEEFILFTAAIGVTMLLRREKDVPTSPVGKVEDRPPLSEAVRAVITPALLITVIFGFYIGLAWAAHSRRRLPGRRYPRHRFSPGLSRRQHRRLQTHHVPCCCGSRRGCRRFLVCPDRRHADFDGTALSHQHPAPGNNRRCFLRREYRAHQCLRGS